MKLPKYLSPVGIVVAAAASMLPCSHVADVKSAAPIFVDPITACVERHNSIVTSAKASLAGGDRDAAIRLLVAARSQLGRCEEIHHNSSASVALGLNDGGTAAHTGTSPRCS